MLSLTVNKALKKWIRRISQRNDIPDRKCMLCGDEEVQNHHVLKIEWLAELYLQHPYIIMEELPIPTCDLCDDCHKEVHKLYGDDKRKVNLTDDQIMKVFEMEQLAEAQLIIDNSIEYADDYNSLIYRLEYEIIEHLQ